MTDFAASSTGKKASGPGAQQSSILPELSSTANGVPGWSHFLPIDHTEVNEKWQGRQRIETVQGMLNHWQVAAVRQAIRLPVSTYTIELDAGTIDPVAASLLAADLDVQIEGGDAQPRLGLTADKFSSRRHFDRAMDALDYGHAVFEQAGDYDAAGYWRLIDLAPVPQWTISDLNSWEVDDKGHLLNVIQWMHNPPVTLPVDHLVTFAWQGAPGDPRGRSMLRPLFLAQTLSDRLIRVMAMSGERTGMGIPVGKVAPGSALDVKQKMEALLAGLAAGHDTNLVVETDDHIEKAVMLMGVTGSTPDIVGMLRYLDDIMARAMLAQLMNLSQGTGTGSFALGQTFDALLSDFHDAVVQWYCDTMNHQIVEPWLRRNRTEDQLSTVVVPRLVWKRREVIEPTPAAPVAALTTAAPAPVAAKRRGAGRRPVAAAASGNTGVMVALYPPPSMAASLALDGGEPAEELHLTLAFLGKADDLAEPAALQAAVRVWAAATPAITGEVSGVGLFTAGEEPVTYLSLDAPALPQARQDLVTALVAAGLTPSEQHGFTPHMTLDYADRVSEVDAGGEMLTFAEVAVVIGDTRTDYRLGESAGAPVSASLARRQRSTRASFAATTGRDLRRDPFEHELAASTDFAAMESQHVAATDDLAAVLLRDREELAAAAVELVQGMVTVDPLTLGATLGPLLAAHAAAMDTGPIVTMLNATAAQGVSQVVGEAARQGVALTASIDYESRAELEAGELLRRLAVQVTEACATQARTITQPPAQASRRGIIGRLLPARLAVVEDTAAVALAIKAFLDSLSPAPVEAAAAGSSGRANGGGRYAAMSDAPVQRCYVSALMDDPNTCLPCEERDGEEFATVAEAMLEFPTGANPLCEGMERCRCVIVAIMGDEQPTLA